MEPVTIRGTEIKYQFPNIRRYAQAEQFGFGESFRQNWIKAAANEKDMAKLVANWPPFIKAVVDTPAEFLLNIEELTTGEVSAIVTGFIVYAWEMRTN